MFVSAIVLAAGKGERFKLRVPKPLVRINSKPAVLYSLVTLSSIPSVRDIIVVVNSRTRTGIEKAIRKYNIRKVKRIVSGGRMRQDSVRCGLQALDKKSDLVLIHDGARPFIEKKAIVLLLREAGRTGAAILGVPVKATIKEAISRQLSAVSRLFVKRTLNRSALWEIQTPQAFKRSLIVRAHERYAGCEVTDDAMLVEKLGVRVSIVMGAYTNIKITTPEDLVLAEAIARKFKTGSSN